MKLSDYTLKFLQKKNVKDVFLINGGAISFMIDAFSRNKKINYISVAHEQSAAMMADAYSRMGPNFSCTMVTSGPGATNLITGIACSYFDSIPALHICGQVNTFEQKDASPSTKKVRQIGFQETEIVEIARPITKYSYKLKSPYEIRYVLEKAYHIATSDRPGPVLIDIPLNFQNFNINENKLKSFKPKKEIKKNNYKKITKKIEFFFKNSKRPVVVLGGGIKYAKAENILNKFLKKIKIPILTTWSGTDLIDHNNKNYIGNIGVYGSRCANFSVQNSDLVFCLGTRLDTRTTGGVPRTFARNAKKIVVDIDKHELNKKRGLKIDLKINSDVKIFLNNFVKHSNKYSAKNEWFNTNFLWKKKFPIIQKKYFNEKKFVNPYVLMDKLSKFTNKDEIIIADDGAHLSWALQAYKVKYNQKLFSAFGNSPMGYSLPASIGASIAKNKKRIICIDGDGSIQINLQELHTIDKLKLPIKILILNNDGFGIIKQFQDLYLGGRYEAAGKGVTNPDFKKVSAAFNINYNVIKNHKNLNKLAKIIRSKRAEIIEIKIKPNQKIIPKLQFGNPIEDLFPLLPRKEFLSNMIVPTIKKKSKIIEIN